MESSLLLRVVLQHVVGNELDRILRSAAIISTNWSYLCLTRSFKASSKRGMSCASR